ncbi:hypothetical protein TCAP_06245 [Tolypocladium capitatum]|uniref:Uncharacterized protein n=1 Tax=Tolypocladium capitatum TaxID=45235 RepID=A0A2K3Q8E4_9HYPO|nr:hypothetical protein TCAP_06245 [Tolypocladium capitatum]
MYRQRGTRRRCRLVCIRRDQGREGWTVEARGTLDLEALWISRQRNGDVFGAAPQLRKELISVRILPICTEPLDRRKTDRGRLGLRNGSARPPCDSTDPHPYVILGPLAARWTALKLPPTPPKPAAPSLGSLSGGAGSCLPTCLLSPTAGFYPFRPRRIGDGPSLAVLLPLSPRLDRAYDYDAVASAFSPPVARNDRTCGSPWSRVGLLLTPMSRSSRDT